jgi:hypothetical protein
MHNPTVWSCQSHKFFGPKDLFVEFDRFGGIVYNEMSD